PARPGIPAHRRLPRGRGSRPPPRLPHGGARPRAPAPRRSPRSGRVRTDLPSVHPPGAGRRGEVTAGARVPPGGLLVLHRPARPVPVLRGGHHVLSPGRGGP